jgi:hypothetical protein
MTDWMKLNRITGKLLTVIEESDLSPDECAVVLGEALAVTLAGIVAVNGISPDPVLRELSKTIRRRVKNIIQESQLTPLDDAIDHVCFDWLGATYGGWENNEGGGNVRL